MEYLTFNKESLVNLEYSLNREILSTNRAGGYLSTTLPLCNTRKYHGLMVLPLPQFNGENHVLLSCVDDKIITHERNFNLGIHKFPEKYSPKGHKYLVDFKYSPTPTLWYRVGNIQLKKELLFVHNKEQIMIRYTVEKSPNPIKLQINPLLAFRNAHALTHANLVANTKYEAVERGAGYKLYEGFPTLYMQTNKKCDWVANPSWFYNVEYKEEVDRGYEGHEDLFMPGFFEAKLKEGDEIIFSASTKESNVKQFTRLFNEETKRRPSKASFEDCLRNSASQFIVQSKKKTQVIAGYPWFGRWGRDTFIALPGLTLSLGDTKTCLQVLDSMVGEMKNGMFPNTDLDDATLFNSVDAPLWFFWVLQRYLEVEEDGSAMLWKKYGKTMLDILDTYTNGEAPYSIQMKDNGLIWQGEAGFALTWMDAVVDGQPVTPRRGYAVEICALWYNALRFTLSLAKKAGKEKKVEKWKEIPSLIERHFMDVFYVQKGGYLADYVDENGRNLDVRPNQIFAISLPFSVVDPDRQRSIVDRIRSDLFTVKGLRTLSPSNFQYKGKYYGDQKTRDNAYHQGTVWPWLLGHFFTSYIKVHGRAATIPLAEEVLQRFEDDMVQYGIGSIPEIYEGDPPHYSRGAISQAWSVAEVIRILKFIQKHKN